jgi:hypothetical protein
LKTSNAIFFFGGGGLPTCPHQTLNEIEDVQLKIQLWLTILQSLNHPK